MRETVGDNDIHGDLVDTNDIISLWCNLISYSYEDYDRRCESSPYESWIVNSQEWWTKINDYGVKYVDTEGRFVDYENITTDAKGICWIIKKRNI